ncbi:phosphatase [Helicobacter burdigaliensis]|uniref:Ppx/GppA phosphatase family protein n=1 Tax=Helicobacter burdigaliensis TaxID=2315334 RepID=UPI000EF6AEC2|nr:phosphatase [Helicobacter burdigaliensis]
MDYVGIDLGSNSLRAVKMDENLQIKGEYERTIRISEELQSKGIIGKSAINRLLEALCELKKVLNITQNDKILAITTEAMRKANNKEEVLSLCIKQCGIAFRIISGEEEARLSALASKRAIKEISKVKRELNKDCFLVVDMGGASSEFIFCKNEKIFSKSFSIGIVTAKDKYSNLQTLLRNKEKILKSLKEFAKEARAEGFDAKFMVANSGIPTSVYAFKVGLDNYHQIKTLGGELTREDFLEQLEKFSNLSLEEKISLVGEYRADVMDIGIYLFLFFMEALDFTRVLVVDEGLREGVIIDALEAVS